MESNFPEPKILLSAFTRLVDDYRNLHDFDVLNYQQYPPVMHDAIHSLNSSITSGSVRTISDPFTAAHARHEFEFVKDPHAQGLLSYIALPRIVFQDNESNIDAVIQAANEMKQELGIHGLESDEELTLESVL